MNGENGTPVTPDWQPVSKPWDQSRCCPTDCPGICETAQHAVFIHLPDTIILGDN